MTLRDRLRAVIERFLPWYDRAEEARRDARTEAIRRHSIAVRIQTERVREAYRQAADRMER